ncbi:hypothetical protein DPMN_035378 [Dreissena polymorpha]|uniref:Uncharacterized protein n=1 Tax=Dreissena polymorpha TaxID=45954 RepID=A0A9D4M9D8_DREPO|nr:hypothetical protein DPMN_035378 [Dreissena polymorpha]
MLLYYLFYQCYQYWIELKEEAAQEEAPVEKRSALDSLTCLYNYHQSLRFSS